MMREVRKKSNAPYYAVMVVWVIWALFLPLYRLPHVLIAAVVSFAVYKIARSLFQDKIVLVNEPETTGNPQLDALVAQKDAALKEMKRLDAAIQDEKVSKNIRTVSDLTEKIVAQVVQKPEKLPQIRQFMNYYLPTTLKILNAYDQMGATGVSGENITASMRKVEVMMDTIAAAFTKQLDALFGSDALDISTDITVLEQMMEREGLAEGAAQATAQAPQKSKIELKL